MLLGPCAPHVHRRLLTLVSIGKNRLYSSSRGQIYLTTPIFYPNSVPHIGHLYTLVTTDIFSRYTRLAHPDKTVTFLTGTDEHGLKIQRAAEAQNLEPREFCDRISRRFRSCR